MQNNRLIVIAIFSLTSIYGFAQNKAIGDSCWKLYISEKSGNDSLKLKLLTEVAFNQINADSILYYSDYLISIAFAKNNPMFLAKAYYCKSIGLVQKSQNDVALKLLINAN